jgi:Domain of unknown function (DUF4185)
MPTRLAAQRAAPQRVFLQFLTGFCLTLTLHPFAVYGQLPYPHSRVIKQIAWLPPSSIIRMAKGSDNWPMTWGDDDNLYTAYGDGWGFEPKAFNKLSLGFAKIAGPVNSFSGTNIRSLTGEQTGGGASGKKASGMLMVDSVVYMWVRNASKGGKHCQLAWSTDHARKWTWSSWKFVDVGYCAFLNFGKNYAGAQDGYVYMYSPNSPSAYTETDQVILARVPKDQITRRAAYEFFKGWEGGRPVWTMDINRRGSVFTFPGGSNRLDVSYSAPLRRYLMTMRSRARVGGLNQFSIYDAPEPWGPWTTVFYTESWDVDPGESQHLPTKWMSADGKILYMVFSGDDSFSVRRATLGFTREATIERDAG